ncbi:MAG: AAA family ATPase, partial [Aquabacterium sp.]|nr:AAA family ATPase [Aquabacterium sp.]
MAMTDADLPALPSATRRRLTLLYSDLSGSTALSAAMEPEDYRALLEMLRRIWHTAAQACQGRVVLTQGDGALLVFGLPLAGEQDGRQAVEAALQVHGHVSALRPAGVPAAWLPLRMHSGIHAGTLLLSDGDIERGVYDLSGDVFNATVMAARAAGPGVVVASLASLGPSAAFFDLEGLPEQDGLSGRPGWQAQLRKVLGRSDVKHRLDAATLQGLTPFIGRASMLSRLQAFVAGGDGEPARCAVLQGGPGLGKTRLLAQLLGVAVPPGVLVLHGACENDLHAEVLQPFLQILRGWLRQQTPVPDALPAALQDLADALAVLAKPGATAAAAADAPHAPGRILEQLFAFFTVLARHRSCLLVIDDWQWADDASRQLLAQLQSDATGLRLLLASRPRDAGGKQVADALLLTLEAFTPDETAQAVHRLLQRPDPFLVARIHDYAGGVPLFIEELCHSVTAEQVLRALDGRTASQGWMATLVVARLQRLPPAQAAVVRAAAVVGNRVPLRWLAASCGETPDPQLLQALADADFLRREPDGDAVRFKHGITRDAVYESIGLSERMALHRRLEAALRDEAAGDQPVESLEALAYHCRGAGSWAAATEHAERAGDRAMAMFALDRARAHYLAASQALERQGPLEGDAARRWCLLANKLGMTCIFDLLALPDALELFRRAVVLADRWGDDGLRARAHYWLGYILYGYGWLRQAQQHCRVSIALAEAHGDGRLVGQVHATLGHVLTG